MTDRRAIPGSKKPVRRWHLPPPLVHGSEPLEGGAVLEEIPGPTGLVLWQAFRDVLLWADTPATERRSLFRTGAGARRRAELRSIGGALADPLSTLACIVDKPDRAESEAVAAACGRVAEWARGGGHLATALAFLQGAAVAAPNDPRAALAVARLAERCGDLARAELWFRRTTGVARRARTWRPYSRAFSGLGRLAHARGNLPAAHRFHLRALRGARRGGLRPEVALCLHDLFAVAVEAGRPTEAERYAREALLAYPKHHPRRVVLAHDVAYSWMEQGRFGAALRVFEAVAPLMTEPAERLWVHADLMRAAAGAGDVARADEAGALVRAWSRDPALEAATSRAQLEIARGELQLGRWEAAEDAARRALRIGSARRQGRIVLSAEALLDAIASARSSGRRVELASGSAGHHVDDGLASELVAALRELAAVEAGGPRPHPTDNESEMNLQQQPEPSVRS